MKTKFAIGKLGLLLEIFIFSCPTFESSVRDDDILTAHKKMPFNKEGTDFKAGKKGRDSASSAGFRQRQHLELVVDRRRVLPDNDSSSSSDDSEDMSP